MKRNTVKLPDVIIDTSTFFSAIYNRQGNEAHLFELADAGKCAIIICEYVMEELDVVFKRKDMDFDMVLDLLDTYSNVFVTELPNLTNDEILLARKLVKDRKDRLIFNFANRIIGSSSNAILVTGDRGFFTEDVQIALNHRVLRTREAIEIITG